MPNEIKFSEYFHLFVKEFDRLDIADKDKSKRLRNLEIQIAVLKGLAGLNAALVGVLIWMLTKGG